VRTRDRAGRALPRTHHPALTGNQVRLGNAAGTKSYIASADTFDERYGQWRNDFVPAHLVQTWLDLILAEEVIE
jgi:hypothetical protein